MIACKLCGFASVPKDLQDGVCKDTSGCRRRCELIAMGKDQSMKARR